MSLKVLVCGGRDYTGGEQMAEVLDQLHRERGIATIVTGGARGADTYAEQWARGKCWLVVYRPDWERYGRSAGVIRNADMLDNEKPDLVLAFPGGRGTADMVRRARKAGVEVIEVTHRRD